MQLALLEAETGENVAPSGGNSAQPTQPDRALQHQIGRLAFPINGLRGSVAGRLTLLSACNSP
jgi:hypothetical protein